MATGLRDRLAWKALEQHYAEIAGTHLRELFAADPRRGERLTAEAAGLYLDYSKNRITDETMRLLVAARRGVAGCASAPGRDVPRRAASTSPRTGRCCTSRCGCRRARRSSSTASTWSREVHEVLDRMAAFATGSRSGEWKGHTGKPHPERRQHRHRRLRPRAR